MQPPDLGCNIVRLTYDFEHHTAVLYLPPLHCVDMRGAIELCQRLDPDVAFIDTWSGPDPDTGYAKMRDNQWRVVRFPRP